MRAGMLPMLATVLSAVGVYYFWAVVLRLDNTVGTVLGMLTAVLASAYFARRKKGK